MIRSNFRKLLLEELHARLVLSGLPVVDVNDTSLFPNRAAVQITSVWDTDGVPGLSANDDAGSCSGALIDDDMVLTAAHCLHDLDRFPAPRGRAEWVFVHAGRDGELHRPYGETGDEHGVCMSDGPTMKTIDTITTSA